MELTLFGALANFPALPYGEIFPKDPYYSSRDKYGDAHPVFNLSVLATIQLYMDEADLKSLLNPLNYENENATKAQMRFFNGNIDETFTVRSSMSSFADSCVFLHVGISERGSHCSRRDDAQDVQAASQDRPRGFALALCPALPSVHYTTS